MGGCPHVALMIPGWLRGEDGRGNALNGLHPGGWWDFPICACCHIYCPTPTARHLGAESWSYVGHRMLCSFCGRRERTGGPPQDWSAKHVDAMRVSLRSRTMWLFIRAAFAHCRGPPSFWLCNGTCCLWRIKARPQCHAWGFPPSYVIHVYKVVPCILNGPAGAPEEPVDADSGRGGRRRH